MRWERVELQLPPKEEVEANKKKPGRKGGREGPGKKWGHTLSVIRGGKLVYVFGGYGRNERQTNDVYVYNTAMGKWSKPNVKGNLPPPRDSHTCTLVGTKLYVFGGTDGAFGLNDLYYLDTTTNIWYKQEPRTSVVPMPREGHSAACIDQKLYLFGGCGKATDSNSDDTYYNDVHVFDPAEETWILVPTKGKPPAARDSHSCSAWGNNLVVFGGEDASSSYLSDVHLLDTHTSQWTLLKTSGERPQPRAGHASVAIGRFLLVFGGFADNRHLFNDLHLLDMASGRWERQPMAGLVPSPRFSLAADLLDPATGQTIFFGGCNETLEALDDMFLLHTGLPLEQASVIPAGEKLSMKKELKRRSQMGLGGDVTPPAKRASLGDYAEPDGSTASPAGQVQQYAAYEARPVAERLFEARITDVFHFGYCIEAKIDNMPLEGMLFSFKPGFEQAAHIRLSQRRAEEEQDRFIEKQARKRERKEKLLVESAVQAQFHAMHSGGQQLAVPTPAAAGSALPGSSMQAVPTGRAQQQEQAHSFQPTNGGVGSMHQPEAASSPLPAPVKEECVQAAVPRPVNEASTPNGSLGEGDGHTGTSTVTPLSARGLLGMQERLAQELQKGDQQAH